MNTTPRLNWNGRDVQLTNHGCGRVAAENDEKAFWQSKMTTAGGLASPPEIVNLRQLARQLGAKEAA